MAQLIKANGLVQEITPADKEEGFSLEELYSYIGCTSIEVQYLKDGKIMVMDEEGKFKDNEINIFATARYRDSRRTKDVVVGNVIICNNKEIK